MAAAETKETATDAVKSFFTTLWPFIGVAFGLIQYIYAHDAAQVSKDVTELKEDVKELRGDILWARQTAAERGARLQRTEEISADNKAQIEDMKTRMNDLEKTLILTNATRR